MVSPLKYDAEVVKEFGIKATEDVEDEVKVGYVREQLDQIKKFLWRERVELQLAEAQTNSDVEALAAKARSDVASHRSNLKGVVASIRVLTELLSELEKKLK
jgi:DNA-binding helix-hairpin-helix protein with protein kinase domain